MLNKGLIREAGHFHAVRFYEDAQSLSRMVATFVAEGFLESLPAIIIATPEHRDAILEKLNAMSFDLDHLKGQGDLIVLDARDTPCSWSTACRTQNNSKRRCFRSLIGPVAAGRSA